ncbi:hypothetical protein GGS26DRAFT_330278 [Hypomontagnella submonticulosa]|nr:hypothetical protein GGS26DRAFT_330278 [Hypomontagnella submonticulosa]
MAFVFPPGIALGPVTPTRGRSVVATQAFGPGDTIAIIPDTLSIAVPDTPHLALTCSYCLAVTSEVSNPLGSPGPSTPKIKVRACAGCKTSYYCSAACQKADWKLVHGLGECKTFKRVRDIVKGEEAKTAPPGEVTDGQWNVLPTPTRAIVQALLRPDVLAAIAEMEGHAEKEGADGKRPLLEFQARAILNYMHRQTTQKSMGETIDVICKLKINSFNRTDVDIGQSGVYFNPMVAMLNHSCIPNAYVQFMGRKAILHAYREIKEGEEIEISYIEKTLHRSHRLNALMAQYHFECHCPRCQHDLDNYEVCQQHPHLELNSLSLVPDLDKLRNPPLKGLLRSNKAMQRYIEEIYPSCSAASLHGVSLIERFKQLQLRWKLCAQLRKAGLYAIEPLSQVLVEGGIYFAERGDLACGLATLCFVEINSEAYKSPLPFCTLRVTSMMMLAKLLANTASITASEASGSNQGLSKRIYQALNHMDQVTMSQVILAMVVHYCPMAHSKEWLIYYQAKDLLEDVESLPGRQKENKLVNAFIRNPNGSEERRFFTTTVLGPVETLAGFALEVMETEFGK